MYFRMLYDDALAQASYLIGCERTGEAIVIDPLRDVERYIHAAVAQRLRIVAVAETHIHADFLSGTREMAERTGAKVYLSDEGDPDWKYRWLDKKAANGNASTSYSHQLLHDGDVFRVGNIQFSVLHTPGHTPEHICFLVTDRGGGADAPMGVLTGDFVFVGDVGRPDLLETAAGISGVKESAARMLFRSIQRFRQLPEYLQIWPAHGAGSACGKALGAVPQSTVGYEKRFNPSFGFSDNQAAFVANILEGQPEPPLYFARMKAENRDGPAVLGSLPQPRPLEAAQLMGLDFSKQAVIDTRRWSFFKAAHIRGALHAPPGSSFHGVVGSYVQPQQPITLIAEEEQLDRLIRDLIHIGLDQIVGFATMATLEAAFERGLPAAKSREIEISAFQKRVHGGEDVILDVRRASEYELGHIAGARNIAHTRLPEHLRELPHDRPILVHCQGGTRSAYATALLEKHGFDATNVAGGFGAWHAAGGEVVRDAAHAAS